MAEKPDDQEVLAGEAWDLCAQALREGQITLKNGRVIDLPPKDLLRHSQWLASLTATKKRRRGAMPALADALRVAATERPARQASGPVVASR